MKASPKVKMTPKMKMSAIVKMTPKMKVTPYTRTTPKIKATSKKTRDERDFGLETETRVVSRPVSSCETTCQKSQYHSKNLRLIPKVSVSVSNETTMQKSQSQSQNVIEYERQEPAPRRGLAPPVLIFQTSPFHQNSEFF